MADELQQQMARQMSLIASAMGNKQSFLFGVIPLDWNSAGPFAMQSCSPLAKNLPTLLSTGKAGGMGDKFLQACMAVPDSLKEIASKAGLMYEGPLPNGPITHGAPRSGGGFELG